MSTRGIRSRRTNYDTRDRRDNEGRSHHTKIRRLPRFAFRRLAMEPLEDRTLPSTYTLQSVLDAYDNVTTGIAILNETGATDIISQALNGVSIPLLNESLANISQLDLSGLLQPSLTSINSMLSSLSGTVNDANATWSQVQQALQNAGFSIAVPFTGTPDSNGNLLEVSYTAPANSVDLGVLLDQNNPSPFSYLNNGLLANFTATATPSMTVTFGVDVPSGQGPTFFVAANPSALSVNLASSIGANAINTDLQIGDLADVSVSNAAQQILGFTGSLGFYSNSGNPLDAGNKLRASDFSGSLSQAVQGNVNGVASFNLGFSMQLTGLGSVPWSGTFREAITNGVLQVPNVALQPPSTSQLLGILGQSLFSLGDEIPVLGPLSNSLNQPLPLIGESIAQLTGLDKDLPTLPSLPSGFDGLSGSYPLAGGTLTVNVTPSTIEQLITGQMVNLVSWEASDDITLADYNFVVPIYSFGIPGIASAEIDATFGLNASLHYHVGFGVDTNGMYIDAGTASDPTLGLSFGVDAGLQGQVEVFGFPLAEVGGDVGLAIEPYVSLTAPPWAADPSKVYLSDLALFGSNPITDLLDDLAVGIQGDLTGNIYASIDLFLFSLSWNWGISIPVFNFDRQPSWPSPVSGGGAVAPWPNVHQNGTTLTFTGTGGNNNITFSTNGSGATVITWPTGNGSGNTSGNSSETFGGISQIVYDGGSGNDTITTAPNFAVPIRAVAGSGNDSFQFQNTTANVTVVGGSGNDTIVAGAGKDMLLAGSGSDVLQAGTSPNAHDSIYGGPGNDTITLDNGQESVYGGSGDDTITALTGSTGVYFIDGGSGTYSAQNPEIIDLSGNSGAGDSIYGGTGGDSFIRGSSGGHDLIYGGGPSDTIYGGGGYDTIYGGAGASTMQPTNNVIFGGDLGDNLLYGAGTGDELYGAVYNPAGTTYGGNTTIYGGPGNETLYGGDGQDLSPNISGTWDAAGDNDDPGGNLLVAGNGNDVLFSDAYGKNTLVAGAGNDVLWAGGAGNPGDGDYLTAGTGIDSLYGGPGNDTFQLHFTPTGQQADIVVGGPGVNSVVLKPDSVDSPALLAPVTSTTATTVEVTNPAALAGEGASNFIIQVDSEQMLVTHVSGDTLTVQRGYDATTAATHSAGDAVVVTKPTLVNTGPSLATAVTSTTATTLSINDASALVPPGAANFVIVIDNEQMLVTNVSGDTFTVQRGYNGTTAATYGAGANVSVVPPTLVVSNPTLTSAITSTTATTLTVTDAVSLAPTGVPNFVIDVDNEQMLVTAIVGNTFTVQRGYNNTTAATHAVGAAVSISTPLALDPAATTITVANAAVLTGGSTTNFVIQVDDEQMLVTNVSGNTLTVQRGYNNTTVAPHLAGAAVSVEPALAAPVSSTSATTITVTDPAAFAPNNGYDQFVWIDNEEMLVTAVAGNILTVVRGFNNTVPTVHSSGALITSAGAPVLDPSTTTLTVANAPALAAGNASNFVIRIDNEQMLVTAVNLTTDTLTVARGYNGTTATTHAAGAYVFLETPAQAHAGDYQIYLTQGAFTETGNTTVGNNTITGLGNTAALTVGEFVTGPGIPASTTILTIPSNGSITLSNGATATVSDAEFGFGSPLTETGNTTAGNSKLSALNVILLAVGETVTGPGIPTGTTVTSIISATNSVILSNPATATATGVSLTFGTLEATLSNLDSGDVLGYANFVLPPGVANLALEGGPGNNLLAVDPSVAEDVSLYGGPGHNTLQAGSGNDTLVAGSGPSLLVGGAGADILYGSDLPQQDGTPALDSAESWSAQSGNTTVNSTTISGLTSTAGLTVGQLVSGSGIPVGSVIRTIASPTSITLSNPATNSAAGVTIAFGSSTPAGNDTLIAGSGNSNLYAGSGNDVLIGGSAKVASNGSIVLVPGAGRDLLEGGAGNDLLIAGEGSLGCIMLAGSGTDTLVAQNNGGNVMEGGNGSGNNLFLGFTGSTDIDASGATGNDTLVGGDGSNTLVGSNGTDTIYDYPDQASWAGAVQQAAQEFHVQLVSPFGPALGGTPQDPLWTLLDSLVTAPQSFTGSQALTNQLTQQFQTLGITDITGTQVETQLADVLTQDPYPGNITQFVGWIDEDPIVHQDLEQILLNLPYVTGSTRNQEQTFLWYNLLADDLVKDATQELIVANQIQSLTAMEETFIANSPTQIQFNLLVDESKALSNDEGNISNLLGANISPDSLQAGTGIDALYGNPTLPTVMEGGGQKDTFYNLNSDDTINGGAGNDNTLAFQGDGTFELQADANQPSKVIDITQTVQQTGTPNGTALLGLSNTTSLFVGELVSGAGIPAPTTITSINNVTNSITLSNAVTGSSAETITFTANSSIAGSVNTATETLTGIQYIAVNTGNANGDVVNLALQSLPAGLEGILVEAGSGNGDVINAGPQSGTSQPDTTGFTAPATLLGGTGIDTIIVGTEISAGTDYQGNSTSELEVAGTQSTGDNVTVKNGLLTVDGLPINSQTGNTTQGTSTITNLQNAALLRTGQSINGNGIPAGSFVGSVNPTTQSITIVDSKGNSVTATQTGNHVTFTFGVIFQTLKAVGFSGNGVITNTFSTDGSLPNVVLQGGDGANVTNNLSASGGTSELVGGNGGATNDLTATAGTGNLIGGSGVNNFDLAGSGNYTIDGEPVQEQSDSTVTNVPAPVSFGMSVSTATLSQARSGSAATTLGDLAFFAGGEADGSGTPSNYVDIYNSLTNTWSNTTLTVPRYGIAATSVGNLAIFAGGDDGNFNPTNTVNIYNIKTGAWSTATLSQARGTLTATTVGTKAIFAGGYGFAPSNVVDIYDSSTGVWSQATLSQARQDPAAASVGTTAIFAGGFYSIPQGDNGPSNVVDMYNASTNVWSTTTLSDPRVDIAATTVGEKAIFAGGMDDNGWTNAVDIYDGSTGTWSTTTLPVNLEAPVATTVGNMAIFAGQDVVNGQTNVLDIYNSSTGVWSSATAFVGQSYAAATAVGTQAIFAGGFSFNSGTTSNAVGILTFGPQVAVTTPTGSSGGMVAIPYTLIDSLSNTCSVQLQYSVDGGPWQNATLGAGGDGATNLKSSATGVSHTLVWNTSADLGNGDFPSVQVRIAATDSIGTGPTQTSGPFSVYNGTAVNTLAISFSDSNNDTVKLVQRGSALLITGSVGGSALNDVALNITSITVTGGTGHNDVDASQVSLPVTLNGGSGSGADTLIGGVGSDTFYYSGVGSSYTGVGGGADTIVYPANSGDVIALTAASTALSPSLTSPTLIVNDVNKPLGHITGIENFFVSGEPASVNNGQQVFWPLDDVPIANGSVTGMTVTSTTAVTTLNATFTDPNGDVDFLSGPNVVATVAWGDGTTSAATITGINGNNFTISGSHDYATDTTRSVLVTVVDNLGTAVSFGTNYTGGLLLDSQGNLWNYDGTTSTKVDSNVETSVLNPPPFVVDDQDPTPTVFTVHSGTGGLWAFVGSAAGKQIDSGVETVLVGPDGTLYDLHSGLGGALYTLAPGSSLTPQPLVSSVETILSDSQGDVYQLDDNGALSVLPPGSSPNTPSNWLTAQAPSESGAIVRSIEPDPSGSSIDVMYTDGDDYQFNGSSWTFLSGPKITISMPATSTAGASVAVTVSVTDGLGEAVTAYSGTVVFASTDGEAGALPPYTFTSGNGGVYAFDETFLTAGVQSLTVTDSANNLSATAALTVNPAAAAYLSVAGSSSDVGVNDALPVTVTAYDAFGNVASGYSGTIDLTGTDPLSTDYTFTIGSGGDNGTHTFYIPFDEVGSQTVSSTDIKTTSLTDARNFIVAPGSVSLAQSIVSAPVSVTPGSTIGVTLIARDGNGNVESTGGLNVAFGLGAESAGGTFSTVTDNGNGTYTAFFTADSNSGSDTITATIGGQAVGSTANVVVLNPPSASTLAASSVTSTSATLNANVDPEGSPTSVTFVYGTIPTLSAGTTTTTAQSAGSGTTSAPFTASLSGLSPDTTYYFEVVATSASGTTDGSVLSFTTSMPPVTPPGTTTNAASSIALSTATLNASVDPEGNSSSVVFVYGTTPTLASGTTTTVAQSIGSGTSNVAVTAPLTGLAANTTYYFEAQATNAGGTTDGSILSFTTAANPPAATTNAASSVTASGATLNASVNPEGAVTSVTFVYGTNPSLSSGTTTTASQAAGSGTSNVPVTSALTGLSANTTYYFEVVATSSGGTVDGSILNFTTTSPVITPPAASTTAATALTFSGGTLNANVNPEGTATSVTFVYGTDPTLTTGTITTSAQAIGVGTSSVAVSAPISSLAAATTYFFQVVATNAGGTTQGSILSFTTAPMPVTQPAASTIAASSITSGGATLNGDVNPEGNATSVTFVFGTDPTLTTGTTTTTAESAGNGSSSVAIATSVTGLQPSTTYFFRVIATNGDGTTDGSILSFTTTHAILTPPGATTIAASSLTSNGATLNANVNPEGTSTSVVFVYGTDPTLTTGTITTTAQAIGGGTSAVAVTQPVSSLQPSTTYFFQVQATNAAGTTNGSILSFVTNKPPLGIPNAPILSSQSDTGISNTDDLTKNNGSANAPLTFTVSGVSPPNAFVQLYNESDGGNPLGSPVQATNGTATITLDGGAGLTLADGSYNFAATDALTAGGTPSTLSSNSNTVTIQTSLQVLNINASASFYNGTTIPLPNNGQIIVTFNHPLAGLAALDPNARGFAADPFVVMLIPSGPDGLTNQQQTGNLWTAPSGVDAGDLPVPATATYSDNGNGTSTITLTPHEPLSTNVYLISINSLQDLAGNPLLSKAGVPGPYYSSFEYLPPSPSTSLQVTFVSTLNGTVPINGSTIPEPDTIGVQFNKPLDSYTVNDSTVLLFAQGANGPVSATVAYSPTNDTAYLTPQITLRANTVYYVGVNGVSDDHTFPSADTAPGGTVSGFATSFKVNPTSPKVSPTLMVSGTSPQNGTPYGNALGYASVMLSEPLNPALAQSILGRFSVMLISHTGGFTTGTSGYADVPLNAKLAYNPNTDQLIIVPTGVLQNDTIYLFSLQGLAAMNGDRLSGTSYATFLLNYAAPPASVVKTSNSAALIAVDAVSTPQVFIPANTTTAAQKPNSIRLTRSVPLQAARPPQGLASGKVRIGMATSDRAVSKLIPAGPLGLVRHPA